MVIDVEGPVPHPPVLVVGPPSALGEIARSWEVAGSVITSCPGPSPGYTCPVLDGGTCPLLAEVAIVLNGLAADARAGELAEALGAAAPDVQVIRAGGR